MIWLSIIILLLGLLVGLFSVAGLHGGVLDNMTILRILRPMRFRSNAYRGVEKLLSLNEEHAYPSGREVKVMKIGILEHGDRGFIELLKVIKENSGLEGEFQKILLIEHPAVIQRPGISTPVERFLALNEDGR
jgi:hypothetical protein